MAQKVHIVLVDDIDGGDADETVSFALDGTQYEIDLSAANAARLREQFAPYVGHARRVAGGAARRGGRGRRGSGGRSAQIREWAKAQGIKVNERGQVAADVVAKYDAAH